jgi:hypothetical protein
MKKQQNIAYLMKISDIFKNHLIKLGQILKSADMFNLKEGSQVENRAIYH